jgi:hypothetical protein
LRRSKDEVQNHISLPNKSEQVLFCSLTEEQRELYKGYLMVCQLLLELHVLHDVLFRVTMWGTFWGKTPKNGF